MKHILRVKDEKSVVDLISRNISGLSKAAVGALFKQGEIRLNGVKCLRDQTVSAGDEVSVFVPSKYITPVEVPIIYYDANILIVDKPPLMDVENNLLSYLKRDYPTVTAVHRLDRNTRGLVIFALNKSACDALLHAFKNRSVDKFYYALVNGKCNLKGDYEAYLVKDSTKAEVKIYAGQVEGGKKIITHFEAAEQFKTTAQLKDKTLLNVKLITGRTHQIRAHLSFLGFPIIGDNKYGQVSNEKNIKLAAYKVVFKDLIAPLEYLNSKEFKTDINFID